MTGQRNDTRRDLVKAVAAGLSSLGVWASVGFAATSIVPRIGLTGLWTDNMNLSSGDQMSSGAIWQIRPGVNFTHESPREFAKLDYQMSAVFFSGGNHQVFHAADLFSESQLISDWLFLDLWGLRTQSAANPAQPVSTNYLFPTDNLANRTSGSIAPILRRTFRLARVEAKYTRSFAQNQPVASQNRPLANSNARDSDITLTSVDPDAQMTWSTRYLRQQEDFNVANSSRYLNERAEAELGLAITSSVRLLARGGKESDPRDGIGRGGLGAASWAGGFVWRPDKRTELRALAGKRFYGNSYEALWRHEGRMLNLEVTYHEEPTTQDSLLAQQSITASQAIIIVPGVPDFVRISPDVFLLKGLSAQARLTGRITKIGLAFTAEQRSYLTVGGVKPPGGGVGTADRDRTATAFMTRRLGPLTEVQLAATFADVHLRDATEYNDKRYSVRLSHRLLVRTTLSLIADHIERTQANNGYKANLVGLSVDTVFGDTPGGIVGAGPRQRTGGVR
jgi:hypothetical protein